MQVREGAFVVPERKFGKSVTFLATHDILVFMTNLTATETLAKCTLRCWLNRNLSWTELNAALAATGLSEERLNELSLEAEEERNEEARLAR